MELSRVRVLIECKFSCFQLNTLFLGACLIASGIKAADLNCEYKSYNNGYTCIILARQIGNNETIQIVGEHLSEMTDQNVQSVAFYGSGMKQIPNKIFKTFSNLSRLDVQVSHLEIIDRDSFQGANSLKQLWAISNFVNRLEAESFMEAFNLEIIDLRSNTIGFVHENAFKNLTSLEKLLLSQNNIIKLSKDTFVELPSLKIIHLHSNMIETLVEGLFEKNYNLEEISLYNNHITIVAADLFKHIVHSSLVNLQKNICINNVYGKVTPLSLLNDEIKICTAENSWVAKNELLSKSLRESNENVISLHEDVEDINFAYNLKLIEITKIRKMNENLEKSLDRYLKVGERCDMKNRQLEMDLKKVVGLLTKEGSGLN